MIESYVVAAEFKFGGAAFSQLDALAKQVIGIAGDVGVLNVEFAKLTRTLKAVGNSASIVSSHLNKAFNGSSGSVTAFNTKLETTVARMDAVAASADRMAAAVRRSSEFAATQPATGGGRSSGGYSSDKNGRNSGKDSSGSFTAGAATVVGAAYFGIKENAELNDTIVKTLLTERTPQAQIPELLQKYRGMILGDAGKYGFAGGIGDISNAYLKSANLLSGLPFDQQMQIVKQVMPYAAVEAKLKDIPITDAMSSFIELAHQTQAYSPDKIKNIIGPILNASMVSTEPLTQIVKAASYSVPYLQAGLGMDPAKLILMQTMLMRAGITNTKSGTWQSAFFSNLIPKNLGSGLFKSSNQQAALQKLGLMSNGKMNFLDENGGVDALKVASIVASHADSMSPVERAGVLKQAFGTQGSRFGAMLMTPAFREQLPILQAMSASVDNPQEIGGLMKQFSLASSAKQLEMNVQTLNMTATQALVGPVNTLVQKANDIVTKATPFASDHPALAGAGAFVGGLTIWKLLRGGWSAVKGADRLTDIPLKSAGNALRTGMSALSDFITSPYIARPAAALGRAGLGFASDAIAPVAALLYSSGLNEGEIGMPNGPLRSAANPQYGNKGISNSIYLDGRLIAEVVTRYQANSLGRPSAGPTNYVMQSTMPYAGQSLSLP